jgi:hypothetical protein
MSENEIEAIFGPPSPGADLIESLRSVVEEIKSTEDTGDMTEMADEAAMYAGRLLADLDELVADLGRGEWGADQLGTLANWLGEHGYDIGDED